MLTRSQKKEYVTSLSKKFSDSKAVFLLDYIGTNVEQMTDFRKQLNQSEAEVFVVRNTLMRKALEDHEDKKEVFSELKGTNALVFSYKDTISVAKLIKKFSKNVESIVYKKGILDGKMLDQAKMNVIASLPSKKELQAQFLNLLQAPMSQLVRLMNQVPGSLVNVLTNYKDKKPKESNGG